MIGKCRLEDIETELRQSHIYPKFTVEYLKSTGSQFLRTSSNPNKRQQDGFKPYLLGERAEQKFSRREKWFSEKIFKPYMKGERVSLPYDEHLFYCAISFLWRILTVHLDNPNIKGRRVATILSEAFSEWKQFLQHGIYPRNFDRIYIFLTDNVISHNIPSEGVDYYVTRSLDATIVTNESLQFVAVYGKFLKFMFWGILKGGNEEDLIDMRIDPIGGKIKNPQSSTEPSINSFLINRISEVAQMPLPSDKQQEKIIQAIRSDPDKFWNSDAGRSIFNDYFNFDLEKE